MGGGSSGSFSRGPSCTRTNWRRTGARRPHDVHFARSPNAKPDASSPARNTRPQRHAGHGGGLTERYVPFRREPAQAASRTHRPRRRRAQPVAGYDADGARTVRLNARTHDVMATQSEPLANRIEAIATDSLGETYPADAVTNSIQHYNYSANLLTYGAAWATRPATSTQSAAWRSATTSSTSPTLATAATTPPPARAPPNDTPNWPAPGPPFAPGPRGGGSKSVQLRNQLISPGGRFRPHRRRNSVVPGSRGALVARRFHLATRSVRSTVALRSSPSSDNVVELPVRRPGRPRTGAAG